MQQRRTNHAVKRLAAQPDVNKRNACLVARLRALERARGLCDFLEAQAQTKV